METCDYAALKEEMIRDCLVVGIRDKSLSEKLQMNAALTLEQAQKAIGQCEAIQDNKAFWRGDSSSDSITVDVFKGKTKSDKHSKKAATSSTAKQCSRCGRGNHKRDSVQHVMLYVTSVIRRDTTMLANVTTAGQQIHSDIAVLDTIGSGHTTSWTVKLKLLGVETMFKLDTGAEATAISENIHSVLGKPNLSNPSKILYGPGVQQLNVLGQFESTLKCKQKLCKQAIFVVRGLQNNLLGLPAIINLNLAARLDATTDYDSLVQNKFPTIFETWENPTQFNSRRMLHLMLFFCEKYSFATAR